VKLSDIATYNSGQNGYVLNTDTTLLEYQTLTIPFGDILLIASTLFILTNRGKITINGALLSEGKIVNSGTMINNGTLNHVGGRFTNTGFVANKGLFGIGAPLYNTGTITNTGPSTITSNVYNYGGGVINTYSTGISIVSGGNLYNPVTNTGCGIGTLVGVTSTGIDCPP
jgi:hypothetical protein